MEKVVTIMHDSQVYAALRCQKKFNRRMALFAAVVTLYILGQEYQRRKQIPTQEVTGEE